MREAEVTRARRAGPAGCWGGARTRWLALQVGEGGEARRGPGGLTGTGGAPLPGGEAGREEGRDGGRGLADGGKGKLWERPAWQRLSSHTLQAGEAGLAPGGCPGWQWGV